MAIENSVFPSDDCVIYRVEDSFVTDSILSVQQRCLHDEVAHCEKTLQTLLSGGQEDLMSKVDSTIEACDDTLSLGVTQTSIEQCQNHVEERSLESFKRRKLSESTLSLDNPCQGQGLSAKTGTLVAVVSALGNVGRAIEAEAVFEEMKEGGLKPRTMAYNVLLKGYVNTGSLRDVESIVTEMERGEVLRDEQSYSLFIDSAYTIAKR
ncbi:hypothetical protein GIB67_017556 [Kingdonia uniflora]|uniref:Pentatricopeptide repeat-containing protein n=1 Tax=Kingdonia uniflora TaxID=39325 RepID=A0A7J7LN22_9MAGN|nr:hypothetical protein GIB67_017556 [Kingdonia uniflora]